MHNPVKCWSAAAVLVLATSACSNQSPTNQQEPARTAHPEASAGQVTARDYDPSRFGDSTHIDNRWFPLRPGTRLDYRGSAIEDGRRERHSVIDIVTDLTKVVDGVRNVVVWERDYSGGRLVETELALYAQDRDGNVWQLGQYPEEWEQGRFVKAPAWVHGIDGARAGIVMHARPRQGTPDYAEGFAPPPIRWIDRGRVHLTGQRTCVAAGCYRDVLVVEEFERSVLGAFQDKYFAPGVGVVRVGWRGANDDSKEVLELVSATTLTPGQLSTVRKQALAQEARAYRISKDVFGRTARSQAAND